MGNFDLNLVYVPTEPPAVQFCGVTCGVYVPVQLYCGVGIIVSFLTDKNLTKNGADH